ncbi:MAG: hypothetical protein Q8P89_03330, partial [bacterium]|nr:hypothetical protein [bacterium]
KQKTVKGIQAFESMKRVINSSVLASTIEEGGFYSLPESSETGQVNFDVSALSGNIDKNGRTIEQDEALVKQGLALLPQIGNQNIKFFESLKASPNPNNPNGDVWGLYRLSDGGKSSMIWIDRNSPGELVLIAAHEGSHSLDIDKYDSLISRYNSPEQMIKLWIARDEAIQANRYLPDGTRIIPFPVWDKYYPYVNGDKAALAKIEPTEFTKMTKEIYYKLSDDTELFAEQFSKFLTGKTGLEPGEKIAYQKYLDLLKNFSK